MEVLLELLNEVKPEYDFKTNKHIASSGDIDSFELMQIVVKIYERFNVKIPEEELIADNFESVDTILDMIERARNGLK